MEALRWILLLIGLVLIGVIYWLGRRQGQDQRREGLFERARRAAREDRGADGPAAGPVEPDLDIGDLDVHGFDVEERPGVAPQRAQPSDSAASRDAFHGHSAEPDTGAARDATARDGPVDEPPSPADAPLTSSTEPAPTAAWPESRDDTVRDPGHVPEPEWEPEPEPPSDGTQAPGAETAQVTAPESEPVVARPPNGGGTNDGDGGGDVQRQTHGEAPPAGPGRTERGARERSRESAAEERVVVLHVVAPEGERLVGARLREALESCGMRHGAYSIFHASDSEGSIVFSAANAVEPGIFDRATMDTLTTPGIALFMQVPGAQSAETVFDRMLSTARAVADALEAQVLDERHSTLTRQTEQHLREELRLLDRRTGSLQQ